MIEKKVVCIILEWATRPIVEVHCSMADVHVDPFIGNSFFLPISITYSRDNTSHAILNMISLIHSVYHLEGQNSFAANRLISQWASHLQSKCGC